ncbi:hypothetical protein TDB9533_04640 [Thalassocella blandensis]|nr:hypothetical protein TDB9533_04640 [Thalassocella blandensis]
MKIALIGATGFVGSEVLLELKRRGHEVTVLTRSPDKLKDQTGILPIQASAYDSVKISDAVKGHDAVISAFNPGWDDAELYKNFMAGHKAIVQGVENAQVKRLIVVGGAGSLFVAPNLQLVDTPEFSQHVPANIVPGAKAARDALLDMEKNTVLDWTFVSPPAFLEPGDRTGSYRLGKDDLLMDGDSPAKISVADLAVAIVDEAEQARFIRSRFTVAAVVPSE